MGRRINKYRFFLLAAVLPAFFLSCPNPLLDRVDEDIAVFRAPAVISTVPAPGAKNVYLDSEIRVKFDKKLDRTTVSEDKIVVADDSGAVAGTVEYNASANTLTFNSDSAFDSQKSYSVLVKKNIKSSEGDPLVDDYRWNFTTGISTSMPSGTLSAVSSTNSDTVTLNITRDNVFVTSMSLYAESGSVARTLIGALGRPFQSEVVYTHSVTAGNEDNYQFSAVFYNDNYNNSNEIFCNVFVDKKPPSAPVVTGQTLTNDTTPTWQWAAVTDAVSYKYSYNESSWTVIGNVTGFTPSSPLTDGTYTLYVRASDSVGNWSSSGSKETVVNSSIVAPTVYITGNPTVTSDSTPTWQWNPVSSATSYRWSYDNASWTTVGNILSYTPSSGLPDGARTLYVQAYVAAWSESGSYTVAIDTTPPAVTYFRINNNATYATSAAVTLNSSVSGASQMQFQNSGGTWSGWNTYNANYAWTLGSGDGTKTVYAQYRDSVGNYLQVSDAIILDTSTPSPSVSIDSDAVYSTSDSRTVTASVSITGDYTQLEFYDSTNLYTGWLDYSGSPVTRNISFTSDGSKTIYVRALDAAGHISGWSSDSIIIDTVHPNAPTVSCSSTSPDTAPVWTWSSNGGGNGNFYREVGDATPDVLTSLTSYTSPLLPDGTYTMYVQEIDDAGNRSSVASKSYVLNVTGITPDNGASVNSDFLGRVTLDWPNPLLGYTDTLYVGIYSSALRRITYQEVYSGTAGQYTNAINTGTATYYWYYSRTGKIGTTTTPVYQFTGTR